MRVGFVASIVVLTVTFASLTSRAATGPAPAPIAPAQTQTPIAPAPAPAAVSADLPTIEQLNAQLADGKQQEVLKQVAKLLLLRGDAAKAYDRYDLLCLRGEAALRSKANPTAVEAFAQASRATEDKDKQAIAHATELLIRRSKPLGYVPRTAGGPPLPSTRPAAARIDPAPGAGAPAAGVAVAVPVAKPQLGGAQQPIPIIDPNDRKRAFAALFADEMAAVEPKLKAAANANNLPPVIDALKSVADLHALDVAANDSAEQSKAMSADLGAHAHQLIDGTMSSMQKRVEECWNSASRQNAVQYPEGQRYSAPGMWGLNSTEQNDLKNVIATAEKIQPVASELATVTGSTELAADAQQAQKLQARASEVLTYDYPNSGRYNKDPKKPAATR